MTEFINANIILEDKILQNAFLYVKDDLIFDVSEKKMDYPVDTIVNCEGNYLSPGFVDIHVHGGGGAEVSDNADNIATCCAAHLRHGTTSILPTTLAQPIGQLKKIIATVKGVVQAGEAPNIVGLHLEGPYLSPLQSGAQNTDNLVLPVKEDYAELFEIWPEGIKIMGVAPELDGAFELADYLKSKNCVASIAHSDATFSQVQMAIQHGFSDVTHLYSGCSTVYREAGYRIAGVVEAGLYFDELSVQIIADGKHLPPALLKLIYKIKGADKISLITDALFPAGEEYVEHKIIQQSNGVPAILEDHVIKLMSKDAFAGSLATMNVLVKNMIELADVPLPDAVKMATKTPATIVSMQDVKGSIAKGMDADLLVFDDNINVYKVFLKGKQINIA